MRLEVSSSSAGGRFEVNHQVSTLGLGGFIDVETTGLNPFRDEVIELALVLFSFNRHTGVMTEIVDHYVGLREPGAPISFWATRVHGIHNRDVKGMSLDRARVLSMAQRAEFLVAHNANFDRGFVGRLFPEMASRPWLCSMSGIDWRGKGFASRGLQNLLRDHGISVTRAHRAADDVMAALELLSQPGPNGETYLRELLRSPSLTRMAPGDRLGEPG